MKNSILQKCLYSHIPENGECTQCERGTLPTNDRRYTFLFYFEKEDSVIAWLLAIEKRL